jgi:FlaG protein
MSDVSPIGYVSPVSSPAATSGVRRVADPRVPAHQHDVAAITEGALPHAYAQLVVNPDTRDVVIRIRDADTHEIISEYPSEAIEHMAKDLMQYLNAVQRRRRAGAPRTEKA